MALEVIPLENVGVEVRGFDMTQSLDDDIRRELVSIFDEHGIV